MKTAKEFVTEKLYLQDSDLPLIEFEQWLDLMSEFADQFKPKWIPVSERLPEYGERVLCFTIHGSIPVCYLGYYYDDNGKFVLAYNGTDVVDNVTHWMPLPEPPKQ